MRFDGPAALTPKPRDLLELLLLAAIWGASFLLMRMGASDFGPAGLAFLRGAGACVLLLPMLMWRGEGSVLRANWGRIAIVGLTNSALPFMCFAYAALVLNAGLSAVFNATTPLWGAVIAWFWLRDRLSAPRVLGLALGFAGVSWLAWDQAGLKPNTQGASPGLAALACMAATGLYGFSASFTKRYLVDIPPMVLAAGSQLSTALLLLVPALVTWPSNSPPMQSWSAALALALICTGVAYVLYFRLLARLGPAQAMSVTYLIPMFAMLWGAVFLDERLTTEVVSAGVIILLGTALTTGMLKFSAR
jgi:drug/metabolite transporter (DMT)-like permease